MNARRMAVIVGATALLIGLIVLLFPASVSADNVGVINCGNGPFVPQSDYVAQCQAKLSGR